MKILQKYARFFGIFIVLVLSITSVNAKIEQVGSDTKYASDSKKSYGSSFPDKVSYNDGSYSGALTKNGQPVRVIMEPEKRKTVTDSRSTSGRGLSDSRPPSSLSYSSGGYSGTLHEVSYDYSSTPVTDKDGNIITFDWTRTVGYSGEVVKPPVWGWQQNYGGTVSTEKKKNEQLGSPESSNSEGVGEPVNIITGSYYATYTDLSLTNIGMDIFVKRAYNSQDNHIGLFGRGWSMNYTSSISIKNSTQVQVNYPDGRRVIFSNIGNNTYYPSNKSNEVLRKVGSTYILVLADQSMYKYNNLGHLTEIKDRNSNIISFIYSGSKLIKVEGSSNYISITYSGNKISSVSDKSGRTIQYQYQGNNLVQVIKPNGRQTYTYNNHGVTSITDEKGIVYLRNSFDAYGRVIHQQDEQGRVTRYTYDELNRINEYISGKVRIKYVYDSNMYIVKKIWEDGTYEAYTYDVDGNKTSIQDRNSHMTHYTYDERGNITKILSPAPFNYETIYNYDSMNNITKIQLPDGNEINYTYDTKGNLTKVKSNIDDNTYAQTYYTYDTLGRVLSIKDPVGNVKSFKYTNDNKKPSKEIKPNGDIISYSYDELGRVSSIHSESGEVLVEYSANDKIERIVDANGNATHMFYDGVGNLIKQILPEQYHSGGESGASHTFKYDGMDRLIKQIDPMGNVYRTFYDQEGNKVKQVNSSYYSTSSDDGIGMEYTYDGSGRVTNMQLPSGQQKRLVYDGNGNVIKVIDYNQYEENTDSGKGYTFTYDALNRLTQVNDANGQAVKRYVYDKVGRVVKEMDAIGILSGSSDNSRIGTLFKYNKAGWLIEKRIPFNNTNGIQYQLTQYTYDKAGRLLHEIVSPEFVTATSYPTVENIIKYEYDEIGRVLSITDSTGAEVLYEYNSNNNVTRQSIKISDTTYNITGYSYDPTGQIIEQWTELDSKDLVTDGDKPIRASTTFEYDRNGNITKRISPEGFITTYEYDNANRLIKVNEEVEASTLTQQNNNIKVVGNYLEAYPGQTYTYSVEVDFEDKIDTLSAILDYDPRLIEVISTNSNIDSVDIDTGIRGKISISSGEIKNTDKIICSIDIKVKELVSGTAYVKFSSLPTYTVSGDTKTVTQAIGKSVVVKGPDHNNDNKVEANDLTLEALEVDMKLPNTNFNYGLDVVPDGTIDTKDLDYIKDWLFEEKDSDIKQVPVDFFEPKLTKFDYATDVEKVIRTTTFTYDKMGNVVSKRDSNGNTELYAYNQLNRLINYTDKAGNVTSYSYDPNGNVIKIINPENQQYGKGMSYIYNDNNQLERIKNANGELVERRVYDIVGRLYKQEDAKGSVTIYTYDFAGNIVSIQTPEMIDKNKEVIYTYDALRNIKTVQNAEGHNTSYIRDLWGRALKVTKADGSSEEYSYDLAGNITSSTDGNNNRTSYEYNTLNKLRSITDPEGSVIHYKYNKDGKVTRLLDREGRQIDFVYNSEGQLLSQENKSTGDVQKYLYNKDGSLSAAINSDVIKTFTYTSNGQLSSVRHNKELELSYSYNKDGAVASVTDNSNKSTNYSYDSIGRIKDVSTSSKIVASYAYNADNTISDIKFANGTTTLFTYDKENRITRVESKNQSKTFEEYRYSYDLNGNITQEKNNGKITSYFYDELDQLTSVIYPDNFRESFTYDDAGNRVERTIGAEEITYTYNSLNQLTEMVSGGETTSYAYDLNGNLLSETVGENETTYRYDGFNRLKEVRLPDNKWMTATYDALNQRVAMVEQGIQTNFTIDRGQVILESNEDDIIKYREIYGYGRIGKEARNEELFNYHTNNHGDITAITNHEGRLTNAYTYDAFGNVRGQLQKITNRYQYAGEQLDSLTGHYYLRARYYNPQVGRFTQEDTYRGDGLNLYGYVKNNPLKYVDPSGHWPEWLDNTVDKVKNVASSAVSKVKETATNVKEWYDKNNVGAYIYTGVEIVGGAAAVAVSTAAIVASGGSGVPAYISLVHGINSVANGIRDLKHITDGDFDEVGTENFLKDNVYENVGKGVGYGLGETIDIVNNINGKESNHSETFSDIGEKVGAFGYYAVDIYGGAQGVKSSIQTLANSSKVKALSSTYYEVGNVIDGFKRMNDLKLTVDGASTAAKIYAGVELAMNASNIYYDSTGAIGDYTEAKCR